MCVWNKEGEKQVREGLKEGRKEGTREAIGLNLTRLDLTQLSRGTYVAYARRNSQDGKA